MARANLGSGWWHWICAPTEKCTNGIKLEEVGGNFSRGQRRGPSLQVPTDLPREEHPNMHSV